MIGHLCLIDFILFRHLKQNDLELEMGSGICLCVGKVLGTPRHPFRNGYLPSSVPFLFTKPSFVGLCTNVPKSVVQYTKCGKCNLTSFGFD